VAVTCLTSRPAVISSTLMGNASEAAKRLVDRFDQDRKVFQSGDYKEEQLLPKSQTPHEQESLQRQIAVTDKQIGDLVYEFYGRASSGDRFNVKPCAS
jgi:hypothetical protein